MIAAEHWQNDYPAANTAAVVTLAAVANKRKQLIRVLWSYSAAPTGGRLTVTDGGVTKLDVDITAAGPASLPLDPFTGSVGGEIVITLAAAGAAVTGKLNVAGV